MKRWLLLALVVAGCSQPVSHLDDQDRADDGVRRARAKAQQGDVAAAIRLYKAALDLNPRLGAAHLDLALLLDDDPRERDYVLAIYHYQRYLDLRPATEKRQMIEGRLRLARQKFAASLVRPERIVQDKAALENENRDLKGRIEALEAELQRLRAEVASGSETKTSTPVAGGETLASANAAGAGGERAASGRLTAAEGAAVGAAAWSGPVTAAVVRLERRAATNAPPVRPAAVTYVVRRGDSLFGLAQRFYRDKTKWRMISDANRAALGGSSKLKIGQRLTIPGATDIPADR